MGSKKQPMLLNAFLLRKLHSLYLAPFKKQRKCNCSKTSENNLYRTCTLATMLSNLHQIDFFNDLLNLPQA